MSAADATVFTIVFMIFLAWLLCCEGIAEHLLTQGVGILLVVAACGVLYVIYTTYRMLGFS